MKRRVTAREALHFEMRLPIYRWSVWMRALGVPRTGRNGRLH